MTHYKEVFKEIDSIIMKYCLPEQFTLDCGCNLGRTLQKLGKNACGIDIAKDKVELCRKAGLTVIKADVESELPMQSGEFDNVLAIDLLEHLRDADSAIDEINRVLKPRGKFIVSVPYHSFLKSLLVLMLNFDEHFNNGEHVRFFTEKALTHMLNEHSFSVLKKHYVGRFYPISNNLVLVCRKVKP